MLRERSLLSGLESNRWRKDRRRVRQGESPRLSLRSLLTEPTSPLLAPSQTLQKISFRILSESLAGPSNMFLIFVANLVLFDGYRRRGPSWARICWRLPLCPPCSASPHPWKTTKPQKYTLFHESTLKGPFWAVSQRKKSEQYHVSVAIRRNLSLVHVKSKFHSLFHDDWKSERHDECRSTRFSSRSMTGHTRLKAASRRKTERACATGVPPDRQQ